MKHAALNTTVAALALTAAAGALALTPSLAGAVAASTAHCSNSKQAGSTKYYVHECAQLVKSKSGKHIVETAYLKNTGKKNPTVSGFVSASWGQAGTGVPIAGVTVAPGHSKTITHSFKITSAGPYTATTSITVAGHTATVQSTFKK